MHYLCTQINAISWIPRQSSTHKIATSNPCTKHKTRNVKSILEDTLGKTGEDEDTAGAQPMH